MAKHDTDRTDKSTDSEIEIGKRQIRVIRVVCALTHPPATAGGTDPTQLLPLGVLLQLPRAVLTTRGPIVQSTDIVG